MDSTKLVRELTETSISSFETACFKLINTIQLLMNTFRLQIIKKDISFIIIPYILSPTPVRIIFTFRRITCRFIDITLWQFKVQNKLQHTMVRQNIRVLNAEVWKILKQFLIYNFVII